MRSHPIGVPLLPRTVLRRRSLGDATSSATGDLTAAYSAYSSDASFAAVVGGGLGDIGVQLQANLSSEAQAWYSQHSTSASQSAAIANGFSAASKIASSGLYNCHGTPRQRWECEYQSGQEAMAAIGGACILVAQVAFPPAAAVLTVYFAIAAAADAIAHELLKALGVPLDPFCQGPNPPATATDSLALSNADPNPQANSFAAFMLPMLGAMGAASMNCKPDARAYVYTQVLPGLVQQWNNLSIGSPIDYYVPRILRGGDYQIYPAPPGQLVNNAPSPPAFQPALTGGAIFYDPAAAPYAFWPLDKVPDINPKTGSGLKIPDNEGKGWLRIKANAGPGNATIGVAKTTALVVGGGAAAAVVGSLAYSYATGKAWDFLLKSAWRDVKAIF